MVWRRTWSHRKVSGNYAQNNEKGGPTSQHQAMVQITSGSIQSSRTCQGLPQPVEDAEMQKSSSTN